VSSGFSWDRTPEVVFVEYYDRYAKEVYNAIAALCDRYAVEIEAWMKSNASWTDRTGNARATLHAEVLRLAEEIVIQFDHGVDYGFYLELAHQARFSIIAPALDHFAPLLIDDVTRLLS
jgi:hypothetical protein